MTVTTLSAHRGDTVSIDQNSLGSLTPSSAGERPPGISNFFTPEQAQSIYATGALAVLAVEMNRIAGWKNFVLVETTNLRRGHSGAMALRCFGESSKGRCEGFIFIDDDHKAGLNSEQDEAVGKPAKAREALAGLKTGAFEDTTTNGWRVLARNPYVLPTLKKQSADPAVPAQRPEAESISKVSQAQTAA